MKLCKHAVKNTAWDVTSRGIETCPFCGGIAPMGTKFKPVDKGDEKIEKLLKKNSRLR